QCGGIGNGKCGQNPPVGGPGKSCNGATQALANAVCTKQGVCSVGGAACNANVLGTPPNGCPETMGTCAKDPSVQCRQSSDCSSIGTCSFTSAACNSQVPCNNIPGQCSITLLGCTTPGIDLTNCPKVGKCSITQAACTTTCPAVAGPLPPSAA